MGWFVFDARKAGRMSEQQQEAQGSLWIGHDINSTKLTIERRPNDVRLRLETRDGHEMLFYVTGEWPQQIATALTSLLQQSASERCGERRCVHCGHNRFINGECWHVFIDKTLCGCKCVFPTTGAGEQRDVWDLLNSRRCDLIVLKLNQGFLEDRDLSDYNALQHVAGLIRELLTPPLPANLAATVAEGEAEKENPDAT
jgi:hypothetical protein